MRIGQGVDVHRFSTDENRPLLLGLVHVPGFAGLAGHSDADVATHALCDALLGAANLGDLGRHFPDTDPETANIASSELLSEIVKKVRFAGFSVESADVTIIAEQPKLAPFMPAMSDALTQIVGCRVSVKATTAEGLGALGRVEGIGAMSVALLKEES
jgi:2-C-methyl-D-erythritol 2,4-cyclodiphosphate synthase